VNADELYLKHILLGIVLRPDLMRLARSEGERGILFRIHLANGAPHHEGLRQGWTDNIG
jgi:hypothetical protein